MLKIVKSLFIFTFFISSCGSSSSSNSSAIRNPSATRFVNKKEQITNLNNLIDRGIFKLTKDIKEKMEKDEFVFVDKYLLQTRSAIDQFKELTQTSKSWLYKIKFANNTKEIEKDEIFSNFLLLFLNVNKQNYLTYLKSYFSEIVLSDELDEYRNNLKEITKTFVNYINNEYKNEIDNLRTYDNIKDSINSKIDDQFLFNNTNKGYYQMKYFIYSLVALMSNNPSDNIIKKIIEEFSESSGYIENGILKKNWIEHDEHLIDQFKRFVNKDYLQKIQKEIDKENNKTIFK